MGQRKLGRRKVLMEKGDSKKKMLKKRGPRPKLKSTARLRGGDKKEGTRPLIEKEKKKSPRLQRKTSKGTATG